MAIKKDYYALEELASGKVTRQDLIQLGANGRLALYALADGWHVELWGQEFEDDPIFGHPAQVAIGPPHKFSDAETVTGPVRLFTETLARYEANPTTTERKFVAPCDDRGPPEFDYEYRLSDLVNGQPQAAISIGACQLVVMRYDLPALRACLDSEHETNSNGGVLDASYEKPKRKAPDAFVAALIRLLVEVAKRAEKHEMQFDVSAMPGTKADLHSIAYKFDPAFDNTLKTFDDYLFKLCQFEQGAKKSDFYKILFPEFFK